MFQACGAALSSERGQRAWTPCPLGAAGPPQVTVKGGMKWLLRLDFTSGHGQEQELELDLLDNVLLRGSKS